MPGTPYGSLAMPVLVTLPPLAYHLPPSAYFHPAGPAPVPGAPPAAVSPQPSHGDHAPPYFYPAPQPLQPQYAPGHYQPNHRRRKSKAKQSVLWTPQEDKLLMELKDERRLGWREILSYFQGRTANACQFRWRRIVSGIMPEASPSERHSIDYLLN